MKITPVKLAKALLAVKYDPFNRKADFDSMAYDQRLILTEDAKIIIKALKRIRDGEDQEVKS